ncbi:MAG: glycosyltransferase family 4 protein [Gammaproteobacteria bacterium]|nr:glycosyltransferase family 4 protein [Gammaproteobacteria bacterium]
MQILFYDVEAQIPYTVLTRLQQGLGGTEATVTRVAHALAEHHEIFVAQLSRSIAEERMIRGVTYLSLETANSLKPDAVILLKKRQWLEPTADLFPNARRFFWLHNIISKDIYYDRKILSAYEIIAVSDFHREHIARRVHGQWHQRLLNNKSLRYECPPIHRIYNPIDDNLTIDQTPWHSNELILASSPRKGLQLNLSAFAEINKIFPEYHLTIATYAPLPETIQLPNNVTFLGSLPQPELLQRIRESFCMFYPQYQDPETFGLVYAESNAVGTPVLAHDFGAAREVLSDPSQLIDGRNIQTVIDKMHAWRKQRPIVQAKPEFRLSAVKKAWLDLLNHSEYE